MTQVSIITPNFNHAELLPRLFHAISNQICTDLEWVIIDDCSTDNSLQVIDDLMKIDPRISLIQNDVNKGTVISCCIGLEACVGEYVYFCAADDVILPDFIATIIAPFIQFPEVQITTSIPIWTDNATQQFKIVDSVLWGGESGFFSPEDFAARLSGGFVAGHATAYRNTPEFQEAYRYILSVDVRWYFDWLLNLHLAFRTGIFYVSEFNAIMVNSSETFSAKGKNNVAEQTQVFSNLLTYLLAEDQEDFLPFWIKSSALSHFGKDEALLALVFNEKKYWSPIIQLLLAEPLYIHTKRVVESVREKIAVTQEKFLDNPSQATMLKLELAKRALRSGLSQ